MLNIVWSNGLGSDQCVLLLQDYLCQDMIKIAQPGHAGAVPTPPPRPGIGQLVPTHALQGTFDHLLKKHR